MTAAEQRTNAEQIYLELYKRWPDNEELQEFIEYLEQTKRMR
jgi:hypothetical protein